MRFGLVENIAQRIISVFETNSSVDKAIVFGSRAKGNYKATSDIDIAIKGQQLTFDDVLELLHKLDELELPYKIDLINYNSLKEPDLIDHIDRVGIELYSRWKEYQFSDFVLINPTVSLKGNEEYSFVEMKDLEDGNKICSPSSKRKTSSGSRFQEKDTLFARITPCLENGKICQVRDLDKGVGFGSTEFLVFRGKENVSDNEFVFYLSRWTEVREFAESNFEGTSGRQRVPKNCFDNLKLSLPPIQEQINIATILSSLDDKIDLLHRQNKTLEQMAETLFRQWFVEEADDSWEEQTLYKCIELIGGGTPKTENPTYWNGHIPWLSGGDIASNHKNFVMTTEKNISELGLNNSSAKILPSLSTIISARGTVGKYCLLSKPMAFSQSNYGIQPKYKECYFFTYLLIAYSVDELLAAAYGSVFDTITTNTFKEHKISLPPIKTIEEFEAKVKPYFQKIRSNQTQIQTLTQTRDTLLPKLMSGEVRVKL
ncbi:MAG: restriction endonuclease subunit S [Bacteroidota bacterium]